MFHKLITKIDELKKLKINSIVQNATFRNADVYNEMVNNFLYLYN